MEPNEKEILKEFQRRFRQHRNEFFGAIKDELFTLGLPLLDAVLDDLLGSLERRIVRKLKPSNRLQQLLNKLKWW